MCDNRHIIWVAILGLLFGHFSFNQARATDIEIDTEMVNDEGEARGFKYGFYLDPTNTGTRLTLSDVIIPPNDKYDGKFGAFGIARQAYENYLANLRKSGTDSQKFIELDQTFESVFSENGLAGFYDAYRSGGLLGSVAGTLIRDVTVPVRYCEGLNNVNTGEAGWAAVNEDLRLIKSKLRVFTNETLQNGYIRLRSEKTFKCKKPNHPAVEYSIKRRWVISILRGLYHEEFPQQAFKYKISALGKQIRLMGYYEIIQPWPSNPAVTPVLVLPSDKEMGHYYIPSNTSCLHIRFAVKPHNGQLIGPSTPNHLEFCASGCRPGDVDGTM